MSNATALLAVIIAALTFHIPRPVALVLVLLALIAPHVEGGK